MIIQRQKWWHLHYHIWQPQWHVLTTLLTMITIMTPTLPHTTVTLTQHYTWMMIIMMNVAWNMSLNFTGINKFVSPRSLLSLQIEASLHPLECMNPHGGFELSRCFRSSLECCWNLRSMNFFWYLSWGNKSERQTTGLYRCRETYNTTQRFDGICVVCCGMNIVRVRRIDGMAVINV